MDNLIKGSFFTTILLSVALLVACQQPPSFQDRYLKFQSIVKQSREDDQASRAEKIEKLYNDLGMYSQDSAALKEMTVPELVARFRSSNDATAITKSATVARQTLVYHDELERRGARNIDRSRDTYSSLLDARLFNEARNHFNKNDGIRWGEPLQLLNSANLTTDHHLLLNVPDIGNDLKLKEGPKRDGPHILVIVHPQCKFAAQSVADIEVNEQLAAILTFHSTWISSAERLTSLAAYQHWNHEHPNFPISIAYRPTEWTEVTAWDSPTFIFMRDSEVVERIVGWPDSRRTTELLALARNMGLMQSEK